MMETPILTDREKLEKWNDICLAKNWAEPGELEKWLFVHGVFFTGAGSCLGASLVSVKIDDAAAAAILVAEGTGEVMATHVLEALTSVMNFTSTDVAIAFWKQVIARMSLEWDLFMPPEIVPKMIRDLLKYPGDQDQGSVES